MDTSSVATPRAGPSSTPPDTEAPPAWFLIPELVAVFAEHLDFETARALWRAFPPYLQVILRGLVRSGRLLAHLRRRRQMTPAAGARLLALHAEHLPWDAPGPEQSPNSFQLELHAGSPASPAARWRGALATVAMRGQSPFGTDESTAAAAWDASLAPHAAALWRAAAAAARLAERDPAFSDGARSVLPAGALPAALLTTAAHASPILLELYLASLPAAERDASFSGLSEYNCHCLVRLSKLHNKLAILCRYGWDLRVGADRNGAELCLEDAGRNGAELRSEDAAGAEGRPTGGRRLALAWWAGTADWGLQVYAKAASELVADALQTERSSVSADTARLRAELRAALLAPDHLGRTALHLAAGLSPRDAWETGWAVDALMGLAERLEAAEVPSAAPSALPSALLAARDAAGQTPLQVARERANYRRGGGGDDFWATKRGNFLEKQTRRAGKAAAAALRAWRACLKRERGSQNR